MIVALVLGVSALATAESDKRVERARSLYQQGMIAMKEGKFNLAKTSFKEVLRIYPNHPQARRQLLYISSNRNALDIKRRKDALRKVIIPQVNLEKATVRESLDMLAIQVGRESKKKVTPNFIVQDPHWRLQKQPGHTQAQPYSSRNPATLYCRSSWWLHPLR